VESFSIWHLLIISIVLVSLTAYLLDKPKNRNDANSIKQADIGNQSNINYYEIIADEISNGSVVRHLWDRAVAESDGDKEKVQTAYTRYRIDDLKGSSKIQVLIDDMPHKRINADLEHDLQNHGSWTANLQNLYKAILGEKNSIYYLMRFEHFDQQLPGLKASWNWPAFFFGGVWALYRKMYVWFFAVLGIAIIANIFYMAGSPGIGALIHIAAQIAFTVYANSLYHDSVKKKIAFAQLTIKDELRLLEYLRYKGGVNTWVIWVFGVIPLIGIMAAILLPMFARQ